MVTAKSKSKASRRRSKEEIAQDKAAKEERRRAREVERVRREEAAAVIRGQMAGRVYEAQLAHERQRERERAEQEDGIEWAEGYNTPGARRFAQRIEKHMADVRESKRRAKIAGDPLNITLHTKPLSAKLRKKLKESERIARGLRFEPVAKNIQQDVFIQTTNEHKSRRTLITTERDYGIECFEADIKKSGGHPKSPSMETKVDTSLKPGNQLSTVAGDRIEVLKREIGELSFLWAVNYVVLGVTPNSMYRKSGGRRTTATARLKEALDDVCAFYERNFVREDEDLRRLRANVRFANELIREGQKELDYPYLDPKKKRKAARL